MGDTLSEETYGGGGDSVYNIGEARRQIHALWTKYTELSTDTSSNVKELAEIKAQNNYMVRLLEKIDLANNAALPRCAERGVKIEDLQKVSADSRDRIEKIEPRLEQLEGTQRILKWVAAIVSAVITALCVKVATT